MIKVFGSVGVVDESKHGANILAHVRAYQWLEVTPLFNLLRNNTTEKDFKNALRIAVEQGLIAVEQRGMRRNPDPPTIAPRAAAATALEARPATTTSRLTFRTQGYNYS